MRRGLVSSAGAAARVVVSVTKDPSPRSWIRARTGRSAGSPRRTRSARQERRPWSWRATSAAGMRSDAPASAAVARLHSSTAMRRRARSTSRRGVAPAARRDGARRPRAPCGGMPGVEHPPAASPTEGAHRRRRGRGAPARAPIGPAPETTAAWPRGAQRVDQRHRLRRRTAPRAPGAATRGWRRAGARARPRRVRRAAPPARSWRPRRPARTCCGQHRAGLGGRQLLRRARRRPATTSGCTRQLHRGRAAAGGVVASRTGSCPP